MRRPVLTKTSQTSFMVPLRHPEGKSARPRLKHKWLIFAALRNYSAKGYVTE